MPAWSWVSPLSVKTSEFEEKKLGQKMARLARPAWIRRAGLFVSGRLRHPNVTDQINPQKV